MYVPVYVNTLYCTLAIGAIKRRRVRLCVFSRVVTKSSGRTTRCVITVACVSLVAVWIGTSVPCVNTRRRRRKPLSSTSRNTTGYVHVQAALLPQLSNSSHIVLFRFAVHVYLHLVSVSLLQSIFSHCRRSRQERTLTMTANSPMTTRL